MPDVTPRSKVRHLTFLSVLIFAEGCTASRNLPLCDEGRRTEMLSHVRTADGFLTAGDSTAAWWSYVNATVWPQDREVCQDEPDGPGEFGRALLFLAEHSDIYRRDSMRTLRRGVHGPFVGEEFYVGGVRLDTHVVALYHRQFK